MQYSNGSAVIRRRGASRRAFPRGAWERETPRARLLVSRPCEGGGRGGGPVSVECTKEACVARSIIEFECVCAASPACKACHFRTSLWVIGEFTDDAEVPRPTPPGPPLHKGGKGGATARMCATKTLVRRVSPRPLVPCLQGGERKGVRVALALLLIAGFTASLRADDRATPTFERDIKPLFVKNCTVCHRASKRDDLDISGGLALDSYEAVLAGTRREKVIVPGRSAESELARRLADSDDDRRMPLQDKPLTAPQQDLVRRWIDQGALRGVPVRAAAAASGRLFRPRPLRYVRDSLEVVSPTDVKLAGHLERTGGRCVVGVIATRAAAGGFVAGIAGRRSSSGRRDIRANHAVGLERRPSVGSTLGYPRTGARPGL